MDRSRTTAPHAGAEARPAPRGHPVVLLALLVVVGAVSTGLWLAAAQFPNLRASLFSLAAAASLLVCVVLTSLNVMVRWFRWHFLIRRYTPQLATRDSLAVYLATLPAIISPFFLAELVRVVLIRKRFRTPAGYLVRIWLIERGLDAAVLGSALLVAHDWRWGGAAAAALALGSVWLFRLALPAGPASRPGWVAVGTLGITAFAWALPVLALALTLALLSTPVADAVALRAFAGGTLLGGVTGLPLGVSVTGSTMIRELTSAGVPEQTGVLAILVYRAGTAWFAVVLGLAALVAFRSRLARLLRGESAAHFDELAGDYADEIPPHVRDRLLDTKLAYLQGALQAHGIAGDARGLDLGCGQGWYLAAMRARGYRVDGTDYSIGQLRRAAAAPAGVGRVVQADAQALPFGDATYDFVYSINAIHHLLSAEAQQRSLQEIVRILRPGGLFLLHEINTRNPLFRWYMGYVFPLLKRIDEGTERWILPTALPDVPGARWRAGETQYFTFLPDSIPRALLPPLAPLERVLERSLLRPLSAHYQACLQKRSPPSSPDANPP